MSSDWNAPLEHIDGTPVKFDTSEGPNPDRTGHYYLAREDSQPLTPRQLETDYESSFFIARSDGTRWGGSPSSILIRNRRAAAADLLERLNAKPELAERMVEHLRKSSRADGGVEARAILSELEPVDPLVALQEVTQLLERYREETPPGHSPHMICHSADRAIAEAKAVIAKAAGDA